MALGCLLGDLSGLQVTGERWLVLLVLGWFALGPMLGCQCTGSGLQLHVL